MAAVRYPRYSKEEAARRGIEIYERDIRSEVEADHNGEFVAIDIETGAWEIHCDQVVAGNRLRTRIPDAQTFLTRVGYGYIRRFGAGGMRTRK